MTRKTHTSSDGKLTVESNMLDIYWKKEQALLLAGNKYNVTKNTGILGSYILRQVMPKNEAEWREFRGSSEDIIMIKDN